MSAGIAIGAAAAQSGVPAKTIRYYEQIGLLGPPARGDNLYRAYGAEDVAMLRFLGRARRLGFSISDLRGLVALYRDRDRTSHDVKALASQHLARIDRKIAELQSLRGALAVLIRDCRGDHRPDCPIIDDFSGADAGRRRRPPEGRRAA
ncbi:MAG TPA: MerR family DNA-binding protein [Rhodocyclaceae bacterium]|nr:MerR family DNA-binding protein [Rhodocyclaceae bacterium]